MKPFVELPSVVAVDPGLSGAIFYLGHGGLTTVWRDFKTLRDLARAVRQAKDCCPERTVIEFVSAMPGQGVCSMFSFGRATGAALGAFFAASDKPIYEVAPQRWQNWYREVIDIPRAAGSFDSTVIAPQVLTAPMLDQCRKKRGSLDHNACDAALIAVWCANQTEEELQDRISEHWKLPEKSARKTRK